MVLLLRPRVRRREDPAAAPARQALQMRPPAVQQKTDDRARDADPHAHSAQDQGGESTKRHRGTG